MAGGNTHVPQMVNAPHHAPIQDHRVPAFAQVQAAHQPQLQELFFGGRLQNLAADNGTPVVV